MEIRKMSIDSPKEAILTALIVLLTATAAFGLGRLSKLAEARPEVTVSHNIEVGESEAGEVNGVMTNVEIGQYVASKKGSKYHHPWCSGAQRITESNKIYFDTKEAAERAGYEPAKNCRGL